MFFLTSRISIHFEQFILHPLHVGVELELWRLSDTAIFAVNTSKFTEILK